MILIVESGEGGALLALHQLHRSNNKCSGFSPLVVETHEEMKEANNREVDDEIDDVEIGSNGLGIS